MTRVKDGIMVACAAGGVLALFATAEFGLPAAIVGAGISAVSGYMAIHKNDPEVRVTGLPSRARKPRARNRIAVADTSSPLVDDREHSLV